MKQVTILKIEPFHIRSLRIFLENEAVVQPLLEIFNEKWSDVPEMFAFPYAICTMHNIDKILFLKLIFSFFLYYFREFTGFRHIKQAYVLQILSETFFFTRLF